MDIIELGELIKESIYELMGTREVEVSLEVPQKIEYGDLSTTYAFKAAKKFGRRPLDIANEIRDHLLSSDIPYVEDVRVEGGGFINIYLNRDRFYTDYFKGLVSKGIELFKGRFGGGYIRIEYTSVNPNKAIHIGHARNILLGASLHHLLSNLGYRTHMINYIDDTGVQMADLLLGFIELNYPLEVGDSQKFDKYCGDVVYVESVKKVEESEKYREIERKILRALEEGDNPISHLGREIASRVLRAQLETCFKLGARYDLLVWESDLIHSGLHNYLDSIREKADNIVEVVSGKYAGTLVIKVSSKPDVDPKFDEVIVRSDGTLTYAGKDLIFAMWKLGLLDMPINIDVFGTNPDGSKIFTSNREGLPYRIDECDVLINVIGREQTKPQNAIKKVIESVYGSETADKYIHYSYELVKLSKESVEKYFGLSTDVSRVKMSGRKGIHFNVDDVLNKMSEIVYRHIIENKSIQNVDEARFIAERVSIASLMYYLLSIDRDKEVVFDIDKALDFKGESGAYILYSYVRAKSIYENVSDEEFEDLDFKVLNQYDLKLARYLALTPIVISSSVKYFEPKYIVRHLYVLAKAFTEFYENNPVLKSDEKLRRQRIFLLKAYLATIELLTQLIGFPLVSKM